MTLVDHVKELLATNGVFQVKTTEGRAGKIKIVHDVPLPRGTIELEIAKLVGEKYGVSVALMDEGNPYRNEFVTEIEIKDATEALPIALNLVQARKHFDRAITSIAKLAVEGSKEGC